MKEDFINLKDYLEMKDKDIKSNLYLIIVCVLLVLILIFSIIYKKEKYYENYIIINNNNSYLLVDRNNLNIIKNNKKLYVDNEEHLYKIQSIENKEDLYKIEVLIDFDCCYVDNINLKYRVHDKDERLIEYVINIIKGGE